jgi:hypothetical protein
VSDISDTSARKVDLAAVYKLPASLIFAGDCLGVSAPVHIAGLDGEVRLPSLKWVLDSQPYIVQPSLDDLPPLAGQRLLERDRRMNDDPWFWGVVASWDPKGREVSQAEVCALVFRFNGVSADNLTYSNYRHGRGYPIGQPVNLLFGEIDAWFEALRIWLRVLTDQDVDQDVEAGRVRIAAQGLEVLTVDGETVSLPRFPSKITLNMPQVQALDERQWRHALNLISHGASPPIEHSLVGTARVQLRLHQYRRAVIDAATAVELALTDFLNTNYASLPSGIQRTLSQNDQTLGWLVKNVPATRSLPTSVTQVFSQFPPDVEAGLLDVRNNVVHRNQILTVAEAVRTVEIALSIVKLAKPLPKVTFT